MKAAGNKGEISSGPLGGQMDATIGGNQYAIVVGAYDKQGTSSMYLFKNQQHYPITPQQQQQNPNIIL